MDIDPEGLSAVASFPRGSTFRQAGRMTGSAWAKPRSRNPFGAAHALGTTIGALGAATYYEILNLQQEECGANDNNSEADCKKIKQSCIQGCSDFVLNKPRRKRVGIAGDDFARCFRRCMDENGC